MVLNRRCFLFFFVSTKGQFCQTRFKIFSLFYCCFVDSLLAKLYIVICIAYHRNVLKYLEILLFLNYI